MIDAPEAAVDPYPRLEPTPTTIKELFAKSGNVCAFPGCRHPVIDEQGNVVAQIVHIRGVRPGAPRFDESQSPEDRRQPSNLTIMCWGHHKATDDEALYPTAKMAEIKASHENRFGGLLAGLRLTLTDQTAYTTSRPPETMALYQTEYGLSDADVRETQVQFVRLQEELARLPPDARSVLATIIERGSHDEDNVYELPIPELRDVLGVSDAALGEQLATLKHNGFVDIDSDLRDGYYSTTEFVYTTPRMPGTDGVPLLDDLVHFSEITGRRVAGVVVELDFRLLDG